MFIFIFIMIKVMPPPQFIFIDIDGTIIGDIIPQIAEWEIIKQFEKSRMFQFKKNLDVQLRNGLIRPYFGEFLESLKVNRDCQFYIYTASEASWAHFIINAIEKCIGIKFNRPIFTRNHCFLNKGQKSLHYVAKIAYEKNKNGTKSLSEFISKSILIDNNNVLSKQEESKLVICPTYNHKEIYDVLRLLSEQVVVERYVDISKILYQYGLFPKVENGTHFSYQVFKSLYFSFIGNSIKDGLKNNKFVKDTFWLNLSLSQ